MTRYQLHHGRKTSLETEANKTLLVVINNFVLKGFLKGVNRVCIDDFTVKRVIKFRSLEKHSPYACSIANVYIHGAF